MEKSLSTLSYSATSRIPSELTNQSREINVAEILALPNDSDVVTFNSGDTILNAHAFNQYLEANIDTGKTLAMTKEQILSMVKKLSLQLSHGGLDSLAMVCTGDKCIRYHSCSIAQAGMTPPVGDSCPIEKSIVLNHVKRLAADFDDLPSYADQLMVQGVAACEILKERVYADMARNPQAVIEVGKGVDRKGNMVTDRVDNPNQKIWAQVNKIEQGLLKSLHMTQEQKKKIEDDTKRKTPDELRNLYKERLRQLKEKNKIDEDVIDITPNPTKEDDHEEVLSGVARGSSNTNKVGQTTRGSRDEDPDFNTPLASGTTRDSRESSGVVGDPEEGLGKNWPIKRGRGRPRKQNPSLNNEPGGNDGTKDPVIGPDDSSMEEVY